ncbi:hypothetical protein [Arthrobacter sp. OAP107]|uniref:hypothetical protein n=1 Tax=Arthrobacter sp. OAP107 TaxID=3156445 RepID=UPI003391C592
MTGCAAQMLDALGDTSIRLLSNNPDKAAQLTALGISVTEQVPTGVYLSPANRAYLAAKRDRTAHTLELSRADVGPVRPAPAGTVPATMRCSAALTIWFPACGNGRRKRSSCAASRRQP